ncbi:VRR-NUC domain-containing protein [Pseudomonas meliae]|uniref:phosphodiesterase I n=1 Tax=Pseudomonas meliae TaxID=86176 RepID=A0A0P9V3D3_9PSED|nr:VRR-NUC domain-containing protein [Pseudomonas meliae]
MALNTAPLDNPFYYLENFRQVLAWIALRYDDLLDAAERRFISEFAEAPVRAQGLLVRMVMRKGVLFRASKLSYVEIGDPREAVQPLLDRGWVVTSPPLGLSELFQLLRRDELTQCFKAHAVKGPERKQAWLERLQPLYEAPQALEQWHPTLSDAVFGLNIMPLCDRLRLLYFGNLYQEWSEFVLADLGIYRYEKVEFSVQSRVINQRADIDVCLQLHACREALETCIDLHALAEQVIAVQCGNAWLHMRRAKLLFRIVQQAERLQDWPLAMAVYRQSSYPGARSRQIRVLERNAEYTAALTLAEQARLAPESDAEVQHLSRVLPRLQRKLGLTGARKRTVQAIARLDVQITPVSGISVERLIRQHLEQEQGGEVHYVENALVNSLFGLLCWKAIFAPLPGAFFHPFHSAPSDLYSPDFYQNRVALFDACLMQLESGEYLTTIREHFQSKFGLQSPFVFWAALTPQLLEQALYCLPAEHLRHWFRRLLQDVKANRTGMPDLIQFFPEQRRYRMIEVKGPGDRLQDNQLRWLDFCAEHGMPVEVCYVQWATEHAADVIEELACHQGALRSS